MNYLNFVKKHLQNANLNVKEENCILNENDLPSKDHIQIIGHVATGKSTILQCLSESLQKERLKVQATDNEPNYERFKYDFKTLQELACLSSQNISEIILVKNNNYSTTLRYCNSIVYYVTDLYICRQYERTVIF